VDSLPLGVIFFYTEQQRVPDLKTISLTLRENAHKAKARIDASALSLDTLIHLPPFQIAELVLSSVAGPVRLGELFDVGFDNRSSTDDVGQPNRLILRGNLQRFDGLCSFTRSGITLVTGAVGNDFARTQYGGAILVDGSVGARALADKRGGLTVIGGDASDSLGCPLPGKLQGIQGGDTIILGCLGNRACERMRRGIVCVGGNIGEHLAHQWIAGTILAMEQIGSNWASQMRRGSLILRSYPSACSGATLSKQRPLELSFLPILWKYLRDLLTQVATTDDLSVSFRGRCTDLAGTLPRGPEVYRSIGDLECKGQGEVLVLS
jgi:formylmethanofuran dehydrogenase subunit C